MSKENYWFISYSTKDNFFVGELVSILQNCNIPYWKAPEMIPAGSNYAREIPKAIFGCNIFLIVISEASQRSIWVEKELDVALCHNKKIIPLKIDNAPLNDTYLFYLNNVQFVDAFTQPNKPLSKPIRERLQTVFLEHFHANIMSEKDFSPKPPEEKAPAQDISENSNRDITPLQDNLPPKLSEEKNYIQSTGVNRSTNLASQNSEINKSPEQKTNVKKIDARTNAFRANKIPLQCEYCGGEVEQSLNSFGVYRCLKCGAENYDDFRKIRTYMEEVGTATMVNISRNTGVSLKTVEQFFKSNSEDNSPIEKNDNNSTAWHFKRWKR